MAKIAQLGEQLIEAHRVTSSNLVLGMFKYKLKLLRF